MPVAFCPRCQRRYSHYKWDTDFVHQCDSGKEALDEEDVLVIGDYISEITGNSVSVGNANLQGTANKVQFMRAGIEGEHIDNKTPRGNNEQTHRQKQHYEYIKLR